MDYRYKAFISYRHQSPDQDIAKKLHTYIENYAIPGSLKKSLGVTKMGRVFRDQEELPLSSNLGDDIHEALEQSEWLICICSPRYLQSKWCLEEVRYFLSLGRRDRILTVLAEGEPEEAFPEQLRFRETENGPEEVEPLAADVRAGAVAESLKKLQNEKLRIMAPMLGVHYDDLRQRAKQRRSRVIMAAGAAVILLLSGFLGFAFRKNAQITQEKNDALIAESKWLAQSADEALDSGDQMLSLLLSLEALPTDFADPERPVTDEALASLRSALISGQGDNRYRSVTQIAVPGLVEYRASDTVLEVFSRETDGRLAFYDLRTGECLGAGTDWEEEAPSWVLFGGKLIEYDIYPDRIQVNGIEASKFMAGKPASFVDYDPYFEHSKEQEYRLVEGADYTGGGYLLLQQKNAGYESMDSVTGVFSAYQLNHSADFQDYGEEGLKIEDAAPLHKDSKYFLLCGYRRDFADGPKPVILKIDVLKSGAERIAFRYELDHSVYHVQTNCDDSVVMGHVSDTMWFWNAKDAQAALTLSRDRLDGAEIKKARFSGKDPSLLAILCDNSCIYLYDCAKDAVVRTLRPGLYQITDMMWSSDSSRLLLTCSDDAARIVTVTDGETVQTLACPFPLKRAEYGERAFDGNSKNDTYILLAGEDRIQVMALAGQGEDPSLLVRLNDKLSVMSTIGDNTYRIAYSPDGSRVWNYHGDGLHVYDSATGETVAVIEGEDTVSTLYSAGPYLFSYRSRGGDSDVESVIRVYELDTLAPVQALDIAYPHQNIYVNGNGEPHVTDRSGRARLSRLELNGDGTVLLAVGDAANDFPCFYAYRTDSWDECWHLGYDSGNGADRIFPFAADWPGSILTDGGFLPGGERVLCSYTYTEHPREDFDDMRHEARIGFGYTLSSIDDFTSRFSRHMAFAVRDALTGEAVNTYHLPYTAVLYYPVLSENLLIVQDAELCVHIHNAETGEEIAAVQGVSRIFDYAVEERGVLLRYELDGTMDCYAATGHVITRDGMVQTVAAEDIGMPRQADGVYGDSPFVASAAGLTHAETGQTLVRWEEKTYHFLTACPDGSSVLLYHPFDAAKSGNQNGDVVLLRYTDGAELRTIALDVLNGRTLTDAQRKTYFLK